MAYKKPLSYLIFLCLHEFFHVDDTMCSFYNNSFVARIMSNCLFREDLKAKRLSHKILLLIIVKNKIFQIREENEKDRSRCLNDLGS